MESEAKNYNADLKTEPAAKSESNKEKSSIQNIRERLNAQNILDNIRFNREELGKAALDAGLTVGQLILLYATYSQLIAEGEEVPESILESLQGLTSQATGYLLSASLVPGIYNQFKSAAQHITAAAIQDSPKAAWLHEKLNSLPNMPEARTLVGNTISAASSLIAKPKPKMG